MPRWRELVMQTWRERLAMGLLTGGAIFAMSFLVDRPGGLQSGRWIIFAAIILVWLVVSTYLGVRIRHIERRHGRTAQTARSKIE